MAYELLGKLYYRDRDAYKRVYEERISSEDAVELDFFIGDRQAFFLQNTEVMKLAYGIARLDKAVSRLSDGLPELAKEQYSKKCLIDEIVLTNRIEGVHSSRKEITEALAVLEGQSEKKGKRHRFVGLVNKYLKLLANEEISLKTCEDIREIYNEVCLEEVVAENPANAPDGRLFRKSATEIHSQTDKVIHKGLYPESEIITAVEKALEFLNDESVEYLFRICIFHYLIEYIHPFYDGNGRLGRFILSCCVSGFMEPLLSFRLSETVKENVSDYYKAFDTCNDHRNLGDLTPFLLMMLNMICTALAALEKSLKEKRASWEKYLLLAEGFEEAKDDEVKALYNILIQAALFSEKGISTEGLKDSLQKSYYGVKRLLGMVRPELLRAEQFGREKYYEINLAAMDNLLFEK